MQLLFSTAQNFHPRFDFHVSGVKIGQRCKGGESASQDICLYNLASIFMLHPSSKRVEGLRVVKNQSQELTGCDQNYLS